MSKEQTEFKSKPVLYISDDMLIGVEIIGHMLREPGEEATRGWREFTGRIFTLVQKIPYKSENDLAPERIKELMINKNNLIHWNPNTFEPYEYTLKMEIPIEVKNV